MESRFLMRAGFLLAAAAEAWAQSGAPSTGAGATIPVPPARPAFGKSPNSPNPGYEMTQRGPAAVPLMVSGAVVVVGGGPPPSPALIETKCEKLSSGSTYTDGKGKFAVMVAQQSEYAESALAGDSTFHCVVQASLAGYITAQAHAYSPRDHPLLTLHPLGVKQGSVVSYTDLDVPKRAREAYDRGIAAADRQDWTAARTEFETALKLFPQYATASYDLGVVYSRQAQWEEARSAWNKSIEFDDRFLKPYVALAELATAESNWRDLAEVTDRAVALDPVSAPVLFLDNAMAHFNLGQMDAAEKSALRAIAADGRHELPRAEYILGRALAHKNDRAGALEHMRRYLELAPNAPDAAKVRAQIASTERPAQ